MQQLLEVAHGHCQPGPPLWQWLVQQLREFPTATHDDGPDAVQMLWRLCLKRAFGIPRIRTGKRTLASVQPPMGAIR